MIAFEPDLGQVLELPVGSYVVRRQMTMVVNDRQVFGVLVVQPLGRRSLQQEIFV
jgi:hypothetical protein